MAFGKKSTPSLVVDVVEIDQLTPPAELKSPVAKPKIKPLGALWVRAKRKANPGYGPQTQRVIHLE